MVAIKVLSLATAVLSLAGSALSLGNPESSENILPSTFKPPQVFRNNNLVRAVNLEKSYPRVTINVVIENISPEPQDEYYIPFTRQEAESIGTLEVKDKKDASLPLFVVEPVAIERSSPTEFYKVTLPKPLASKSQQTLTISYSRLQSVRPLPALIAQTDAQYLVHEFSAYWPSSYTSLKQKTDVKFLTTKVPDFTKIENFPTVAGTKYTYGPFGEVPAGATEAVRVRYEYTRPVIHVSRLERDIEVSHWGGNIAFEERYNLHNHAANLSEQFNRVKWAQLQRVQPMSTAMKELKFPLAVGSKDVYYTDVIGNVTTSRFRSNSREANLEIKPRYPVFGGWHFPFRIGWNAETADYLRKLAVGDVETYILNVPFLEGPKQPEGVAYEDVELRVILPEGASNVKFQTTVPITSHSITTHRTFMDTIGRTSLNIRARNLVDDIRGREIIVTYQYPLMAGLRKPLVIFGSVLSLLAGVWVLGRLNTSISAKRAI